MTKDKEIKCSIHYLFPILQIVMSNIVAIIAFIFSVYVSSGFMQLEKVMNEAIVKWKTNEDVSTTVDIRVSQNICSITVLDPIKAPS